MKHTLKVIGRLFIALGIYVLSCMSMWQYNHKAFSKGGRLDNIKPGFEIAFITYCPIANTSAAITWRLLDCDFDFSNHFNIKK